MTEAGAKAKILLNASLTLDQYALFRSEAVNGRYIVDSWRTSATLGAKAWWTEFEARVPGKDAVEEDPVLSILRGTGVWYRLMVQRPIQPRPLFRRSSRSC